MPRARLKRKVDDRGIEAMEFVFEPEVMLGCDHTTSLINLLKVDSIKRCGALVIGVRKGCARNSFGAEMVQAFCSGIHGTDTVSQTDPTGQLHKCQVNELFPAAKGARFSAGTMDLFQGLKLMSGNKVEHLMKKCVMICHSLIILLLSLSYRQTHFNKM